MDIFNLILIVIVLAIISGVTMCALSDAQKEEKFIAECTKYEKEYKCMVMWRDSDKTTNITTYPVMVK